MIYSKTIHNTHTFPLTLIPNPKPYAATGNRGAIWEGEPSKFMLNQIINLIDQAKQMICAQSFIMDDNALLTALVRASKRGVHIFLLGATVKLSPPDEEKNFSTEKYKKLLEKKIKGQILYRASNSFHGKYILIDPKSDQPQGVLLTANFTQNALAKNPELAIPLTKHQVEDFYKLFRYTFWEKAEEEHTARRDFQPLAPAQQFDIPQLEEAIPTELGGNKPLLSMLLEQVNEAKKSIYLSTFNLDPEHQVSQALISKAKEGVPVTLFFPKRPHKIKEACKPFLDAGAKVFIQDHLHAKFLLVDTRIASLFTSNIETKGLDEGHDVGAMLDKDQVLALSKLIKEWEASFEQLQKEIQIPNVKGPCISLGKEPVELQIKAEEEVEKEIFLKSYIDFEKVVNGLQGAKYAHRTLFKLKVDIPKWSGKMGRKDKLTEHASIMTIDKRKGKTENVLLIKDVKALEELRDLPRGRHTNLQIYAEK